MHKKGYMYTYKTDQIVIAACICINKPEKDYEKWLLGGRGGEMDERGERERATSQYSLFHIFWFLNNETTLLNIIYSKKFFPELKKVKMIGSLSVCTC